MASTTTFRSFVGKLLPASNVLNGAGAPAYALSAKHALAQYAATGCFNATYYATAEQQLDRVIALAYAVEPSFLAKTAIFSRQRGAMKDMPALLCAALSIAEPSLCAAIFPRVIDDAKMLRNFVQMVRSGVTGRKSMGTAPKRLHRNPARAELERKYGYDTKHAMHLIRLMRMGLEVLKVGDLRVRRDDAHELSAIRDGAMPFDELLATATALQAPMERAAGMTKLPGAR